MKSFPESPNMSPGPLNNCQAQSSPQHMMNPLKMTQNHLNMNINMQNFADQLKEGFDEQMKDVNNGDTNSGGDAENEDMVPLEQVLEKH